MVKLKSKNDSRAMRFIGRFRPDFMTRYWTTVGDTIYYPTSVQDPNHKSHDDAVSHELVHVSQYRKFGKALFLFLYLFVPVPFFFAYFRWKFEREAYLVQIHEGALVENVVQTLWSGYVCPWPRFLMRKWFHKKINQNRS